MLCFVQTSQRNLWIFYEYCELDQSQWVRLLQVFDVLSQSRLFLIFQFHGLFHLLPYFCPPFFKHRQGASTIDLQKPRHQQPNVLPAPCKWTRIIQVPRNQLATNNPCFGSIKANRMCKQYSTYISLNVLMSNINHKISQNITHPGTQTFELDSPNVLMVSVDMVMFQFMKPSGRVSISDSRLTPATLSWMHCRKVLPSSKTLRNLSSSLTHPFMQVWCTICSSDFSWLVGFR